MIQEFDSEGNPRCVYCGQAMLPRKVCRDKHLLVNSVEVGYNNTRIFCSKNCGYIMGLIHAHFLLQKGQDEQCRTATSITSRQRETSQASGEEVLSQGAWGISNYVCGSVSMAVCIASLATSHNTTELHGGSSPLFACGFSPDILGDLGFGDATAT